MEDKESKFIPEGSGGDLIPVPSQPVAMPAAGHNFDAVLADEEPRAGEGHGKLIWRGKRLVALCVLSCGVAAFFFSRYQQPVYRTTTSLEVQPLNDDFLKLGDVNPVSRTADQLPGAFIQGQIEILSSRAMIGKVVDGMGTGLPADFVQHRGWLGGVRDVLGLAPAPQVPFREHAVDVARSNLKITTPLGTRVITIQYQASDPKAAAEFANLLARTYIEENLQLRLKAMQGTTDWLNHQVDLLRGKLQNSEAQLQAYSRSVGLLYTGERENISELKLKQLQDDLSRAETDRMNQQSRYELLKSSSPDTLPDALQGTAIREYQIKSAELSQQLAQTSTLLTPNHYKVKELQAQVAEIEKAMDREQKALAQRITNAYESARRREQLLSAAYRSQATLVTGQGILAARYNLLKREVDTNRQLYETMLQKVNEASMAGAMRANHIAVFDPAEPPSQPFKPDILLNTAVGLVFGLFFGISLIYMRERADRRLHSPGDIAQFLRVPELGAVVTGALDPEVRKYLNGKPAPGSLGADGKLPPRFELVTWSNAGSAPAESFHGAVTSILAQIGEMRQSQVIVVTSPSPGEGKTTVATNLAVVLARTNRRVLLLDGDLRRAKIHSILGLSNEWGLSDYLKEDVNTEAYQGSVLGRQTVVPNLNVMSSGSDGINPTDLLYSRRLPALLSRFRNEYEVIVVDTPPILAVADARIVARHADAVVMVLRSGETNRNTARTAIGRLTADGVPLLGTVLNGWNPQKDPGSYGSHYYKSYRTYAKR